MFPLCRDSVFTIPKLALGGGFDIEHRSPFSPWSLLTAVALSEESEL